ncbi:MAG TPA: DUF5615 family PIN-like protein [Chitinophaga sp.]
MPPEQKWEIWLDTHISPIIAKWMKEYTGYEVKSSYSLSLHEMTDIDIYQKARAQGKVILISKDADFPELISRLGAPPKLINIKIGNCDNRAMTLNKILKKAPACARAFLFCKAAILKFFYSTIPSLPVRGCPL